ncbi:MAG: hypothetical protein LBF57_00945 [Holosporaceae bacterium]|nr:hypothetical protein [Holosporaceae bacterium]
MNQNINKNTGKVLNLNQTKSSTYFRKSVRKLLSSKGAILIEFAVSIPVLVVLMYYMHDVPKLARIHERMEFCAHCAVNMFQNISQNRADKKITLKDLDYIVSSAMLPYFGGGTNQYAQSGYILPCGFEPEALIYCVLGIGENKAKILWIAYSDWNWLPGAKKFTYLSSAPSNRSIIKGSLNTEMDCSSIYKDLTIKDGEMKILFVKVLAV